MNSAAENGTKEARTTGRKAHKESTTGLVAIIESGKLHRLGTEKQENIPCGANGSRRPRDPD